MFWFCARIFCPWVLTVVQTKVGGAHKIWRVYLHGIQLSVVKLGWMSEVVFRRLLEEISEPADEASAGFSASFGLDFVWKNPSTKGGRR